MKQLKSMQNSSEKNIHKLDKELVWHPFTQHATSPDHVVVKSAKGAYLHLEDGTQLLDAVSSWWVNLFGHAHPEVAKAIGNQAAEMEQ